MENENEKSGNMKNWEKYHRNFKITHGILPNLLLHFTYGVFFFCFTPEKKFVFSLESLYFQSFSAKCRECKILMDR